jgi:hypothetical protein
MNTNDERSRELIEEITRYLATVEVFRSVGCEPTWRPEPTGLDTTDEPRHATTAIASAH